MGGTKRERTIRRRISRPIIRQIDDLFLKSFYVKYDVINTGLKYSSIIAFVYRLIVIRRNSFRSEKQARQASILPQPCRAIFNDARVRNLFAISAKSNEP